MALRKNLQKEAITRSLVGQVEQGGVMPKPPMKPELAEGYEWRCRVCQGDKFAEFKNGELVIIYRERKMTVQAPDARYQVRCKKCNTLNVMNVSGLKIRLVPYKPPQASPRAAEIAAEAGLALENIIGTGDGGRILVDDVRDYMSRVQEHSPDKLVSSKIESVLDIKQERLPKRPPPGTAGDIVDIDNQG